MSATRRSPHQKCPHARVKYTPRSYRPINTCTCDGGGGGWPYSPATQATPRGACHSLPSHKRPPRQALQCPPRGTTSPQRRRTPPAPHYMTYTCNPAPYLGGSGPHGARAPAQTAAGAGPHETALLCREKLGRFSRQRQRGGNFWCRRAALSTPHKPQGWRRACEAHAHAPRRALCTRPGAACTVWAVVVRLSAGGGGGVRLCHCCFVGAGH